MRNQSGPAATIPYARYDAMVPQAMTMMARAVAEDEMRADLLRKDFSLTVTSGSAPLTTALTASEPLILKYLWLAKITSADSTFPWQSLPDFITLSLTRPTFGLIYYCIEGSTLLCTDTNGATGALTTTATANANFVPLVASLSANLDLEELGIATLAQMMIGGEQNAAAA